MPIPHATLSVLQAAGAAIFAADAELKKTADDYSEQVKLAMLQNPFDVGNDGLFENWKTVARLAQAVAQIEAEFKKIYSAAKDVSATARPARGTAPALSGPSSSAVTLELVKEVQATDVVVKKTRKARKLAKPGKPVKASKPVKAGKAGKAVKAVRSTAQKSARPLRGNNAKLLAHLVDKLNPNEGSKVNWSAVAVDIGIPKGSIGAARIKLLQTGHLVEEPVGSFKLSLPAA